MLWFTGRRTWPNIRYVSGSGGLAPGRLRNGLTEQVLWIPHARFIWEYVPHFTNPQTGVARGRACRAFGGLGPCAAAKSSGSSRL